MKHTARQAVPFATLLLRTAADPDQTFAAHGSLSWIRSLTALDVYEGGLVDPGDSAQQARFSTERGDGTKQLDLTVTFKGHWPLAEQLDLMEALRLGLEAGCDHSWRARMRIERRR